MKRKIIFIFLLINILLSNAIIVNADDYIEEDLYNEDISQIIETSNAISDDLKINSRIAVAYDRKSERVIWGKNENTRSAMASTTKIMTAIITLENADLNDVVEVSAKAGGTGGSRLGLKRGDKISINDLLYGLMLRSGNDAAVAIAEYVGGSIERFAEMMNEKAEELNLIDTNFVTPHGLDDPNHYTTAYELAKVTDYALKNETFRNIVKTKFYTITINGYQKALNNTNELLGVVPGVNGVKTGFTGNAGRCLVTSVDRDGFEIITVVLQADTKKDRGRDSINIIKNVYENYQQVNVKEIVENEFENWCKINKGRIEIDKAKNNHILLKHDNVENEIIVVNKEKIDDIHIEINAIFQFKSPVNKGTIIGNMKLMVEDEVVDSMNVYFDNNIEKKQTKDYLFEFFRAYQNLKIKVL